jgi:hypothetical protein
MERLDLHFVMGGVSYHAVIRVKETLNGKDYLIQVVGDGEANPLVFEYPVIKESGGCLHVEQEKNQIKLKIASLLCKQQVSSQAGRGRSELDEFSSDRPSAGEVFIAVLSWLPGCGHKDCPAYDQEPTCIRRPIDVVLFVRRNMNRTCVHDVLTAGVGKTCPDQHDDADDDQSKADSFLHNSWLATRIAPFRLV